MLRMAIAPSAAFFSKRHLDLGRYKRSGKMLCSQSVLLGAKIIKEWILGPGKDPPVFHVINLVLEVGRHHIRG